MAKTHRIEVRLNDEDHALLVKRAHGFGGNMTEAIESLLHAIRPVAILGVKKGRNERPRWVQLALLKWHGGPWISLVTRPTDNGSGEGTTRTLKRGDRWK